MGAGEGERLHAQQRKRFWLTIGGLMLIGFVAGLVGSYVERVETGDAVSPGMQLAAAAGVILVAALAAFGSWKFFANVDEVEVADNLWGSLVGFYAYAILLPVWWALWKLGLVGDPNDWAIYGASMMVALAAYFYRKWQSR